MNELLELRLRLERGAGSGAYRIVASGPGGEASGDFANPFSPMELENFVLKVGGARRAVRRVNSPEAELTRQFGTRLFDALFADPDVREVYRSSRQRARTASEPLRLTLSMREVPDLLQIPWEYLYDHPDYLAISRWTPIVRYLDLPTPIQPLAVKLPIHILGVVSGPTDALPIDATAERAKLATAIEPLTAMGGVTVDWLEEPSLLALNRELERRDYHVLHYIGHAGFDPGTQDGVLLFEDESRRGKPVSGEQLGNILRDEVSLRLVVLNACEGARTAADDPFSGVAASLIERDVPAVVAMQFEITDRAAILFASEFYTSLANGMSVDTAVAQARRGIYADENQIEWGTPVVFMRVRDGHLFDVATHPEIAPAQRDALLVTAAHEGLLVLDEPADQTPDVAAAVAAPPVEPPPVEPPPVEPLPPPVAKSAPREHPIPTPVEPVPPAPVPPGGWPPWVVALGGASLLGLVVAGFLLFGGGGGDEGPGASSPPVTAEFVPNVYRLPYDEAEQLIRETGFTNIRTEFVCSGRLAGEPNVVREVLIDVGAPDGTPSDPANRLVGDQGEPLRSELLIPLDTPLHVKVSNGSGC